MIIWLNGTFGVGKTTTSTHLQIRLENSRIFDPEHVGYMLSSNFKDVDFSDFQDLPPWRALVPHALKTVHDFTNSRVIAPQTVLRQQYWLDLRTGMKDLELDVTHIVLDCHEDVLRSRIDDDEDQGPTQWRHDHVATYLDARPWMLDAADLIIDTTTMSALDVTEVIIAALTKDE